MIRTALKLKTWMKHGRKKLKKQKKEENGMMD
jgi:hypothetical protein